MAFSYYRPVTIDHTKVPNTDQTNFPVGFVGVYSWCATVANGGRAQSASGYDAAIPFPNSGLTSGLDYELVAGTYNATTGAIERYFRQPTLSHSVDDVVYMAIGDASISVDGSTSTTWNSNFKAVYHMAGASSVILTSSAQTSNTLTNNNTVTRTDGPIANVGGSGGFASASSQSLTSATAAVTALPITMSALIYETNLVANQEVVCMNPTAANQSGVDLQTRAAGTLVRVLQNAPSVDSAAISNTTWYHVAGRYVSTTDRNVVLNGTNTQNTTSSALNTPNQISVGAFKSNGASSGFFNGRIDELRISDVDRGVDWLTTEYNNLLSPSTFYSVGSEVAVGGAARRRVRLCT